MRTLFKWDRPNSSVDRRVNTSNLSNFTEPQKMWVERVVNAIGFPLNNIHKIDFEEGGYRQQTIFDFLLGQRQVTAGAYYIYNGKLSVTKDSISFLPKEKVFGTFVHELAHANDPLGLGGQEGNLEQAQNEEIANHVKGVAQQSLDTWRFLNPYHKRLATQLAWGKISKELFQHETHAILLELRFTNPKHLRQLEAAQKKIAKRKGFSFTPILSKKGSRKLSGVDKTVSILTGGKLKTPKAVSRHVEIAKRIVKQSSYPFDIYRRRGTV